MSDMSTFARAWLANINAQPSTVDAYEQLRGLDDGDQKLSQLGRGSLTAPPATEEATDER